MKVLNLRCSQLHFFEGWFGSEDDFQNQSQRGLVACPMCADTGVQKMPSAPRLNFGGHANPDHSPSAGVSSAQPAVKGEMPCASGAENGVTTEPGHAAQAAFLSVLRQVMATTEDMGAGFAEEARRMHYGEIKARAIRGQASAREAVELLEEGIDVIPLPFAVARKETLQ